MASAPKRCSGCGVRLSDDNWTPGRQRAGHYICRVCTAKRQQAYKNRIGRDLVQKRANAAKCLRRARDPDRHRTQMFINCLWSRYRLTPDDYNTLLFKQGGGCAICGKSPDQVTSFHVDHCHDTGRVRGLLCAKCNLLLGHADDSTQRLRRAIAYLIDPTN